MQVKILGVDVSDIPHDPHSPDFDRAVAVRVLERLGEVPESLSWQPIAEAPRDGTVIDLWVVWSDGMEGRKASAFWNAEAEQWQIGSFHLGQFMDKGVRATHFRRLPAGPNGEAS